MILERFQSADPRAHDHTKTVSPFEFVDINPAIRDRHFCCGHRKLRESIGPADVLWVFEERLRIEIANLPTDFTIVSCRIERIDCTDAANSVLQVGPKCLDVTAYRRNGTEASDNNSAIVIHLAI